MNSASKKIRKLCSCIVICSYVFLVQSVAHSATVCDVPSVSSYDSVGCLEQGLALVEKDGKYGFVDAAGNEVIPVQYDYALSFLEGFARVEKNGKYGLINTTGHEVIPLQ